MAKPFRTSRPASIEVLNPELAPSAGADDFKPLASWCSVAILMLFMLFSIMDRQIIALMVDPIKRDLGLSDTQLGLLQGLAFALLYAVAGLPLGWAVDRFPRRIILYFGITIWSLSSAFCGLAQNFWQMFAGRTFVGVGEAALGPAAVSLISDLFPREKVATPLGVYSAGYYIGGGVALAIGGWIIGLFAGSEAISVPLIGNIASWQAVFLTAGLPGIGVAFLAFLIRDPRAVDHLRTTTLSARDHGGFGAFLRLRRNLICLTFAGFSLATLMNYAVSSWTPAYFMRVFGWSAADIGWRYGLVVGVSGATGAFVGGMIMDRVFRRGRRDAYLLISAVGAIASTPFLVGAYFVASPVLAMLLLCIGLSLAGVIAAGSYATWQRIAPPAFRGRVTALFILLASLSGSGLGPLLVGFITDYVMQNEALVGHSVALVVALCMPLMAAMFLAGRKDMRLLPD